MWLLKSTDLSTDNTFSFYVVNCKFSQPMQPKSKLLHGITLIKFHFQAMKLMKLHERCV